MICGHGSRHKDTSTEFQNFIKEIKKRFPKNPLSYGFLEISSPNVKLELTKLIRAKTSRILTVPVMLFAAGHIKKDIPDLIKASLSGNSSTKIKISREIGLDQKLIKAAKQKIEETQQTSSQSISKKETLLMMVGRGTSMEKVNKKIEKISRSLRNQIKFLDNDTSFMGITGPRFENSLIISARRKFKRIIIFPYFLFTGVLLDRIHSVTNKISKKFPETEFLISPCFKDHPLVIDAFADRITKGLKGF